MCMSSIPASAMTADQNDLNPSMGRGSRLITVVLLYDSDALPVAAQYDLLLRSSGRPPHKGSGACGQWQFKI